uniref:Uncharacterized protein n=1 Tax=Rhizophora mucronata TaxID=61149 RepID=A0A2P2Q1V4_RHIMU
MSTSLPLFPQMTVSTFLCLFNAKIYQIAFTQHELKNNCKCN